jgi:uncharacterized protein YcnI
VNHRHAARALAVAAVALVAAAPAAGAHVTVQPGEATQGGYTVVNVRVPNERDDSGTTSVEFNLPEDTPIRSVRVTPVPGWEYEMEMRELDEPMEAGEGEPVTEVVSSITWSGGVINPGEFVEFPVSLGPLPEDVDELMFPSIQTYESGEVVRWIEPPAEDGSEVEHPAPLLSLLPPEEEAAAPAAEEEAAGPTVENVATQDDVDSANTMGLIGIVVGVLGLAVGGFALVRSRSGAPVPASVPAAASTTSTTASTTAPTEASKDED